MARILFTFAGGEGHLRPFLPVAEAAAAAGHDVLVSGAANLASRTELPYAPSGPDVEAVHAPLVAYDRERELAALRRSFAGRFAEARERDLEPLCARWRPDVLVRDETDFGAAVVAERRGVRHAMVLSSASEGLVPADIIGRFPAPAEVLTPFPPALRPGGRPFRAVEAAPGEGRLILVTLGTIFNTESGDLFERVLAGLEGDVVVATGDTRDPAELGPRPPRVRLERRVDLGAILPRTSVVVCHAGSGTLLAALAHGVPLVCLPIGADQPSNARRAVELGAAIALDPLTATPAEIAAAVRAAPARRAAAQRVARAIAALPPPAAAVTMLTGQAPAREK